MNLNSLDFTPFSLLADLSCGPLGTSFQSEKEVAHLFFADPQPTKITYKINFSAYRYHK
jgi:hypothetical protein